MHAEEQLEMPSTPPSPSPQVRARYSTPTLVHTPPSTRKTPIPLREGIPIHQAHAFPLKSPAPPVRTAGIIRIPPKRRSARIRIAADLKVEDPPPVQSAPVETRGLGMYDNPEDFDEVQLNLPSDGEPLPPSDKDSSADTSDSDTEMSAVAAPSYAPPVCESYPAPRSPGEVFLASHSNWVVRTLLTLVAFLHTKHHMSFRACGLILFILNILLTASGIIQPSEPMPVTLQTVIKRLDLEDRFTVYPVCSSCHHIFEPNVDADTICPECDTAIFKPVSAALFERITGRKPHPPPPVMAAPIQVLSSLLSDFLSRPDMENGCLDWKHRTEIPGELHDMQDGEIWKTIIGNDGKCFFDPEDDSDELRIGVTLGLDW